MRKILSGWICAIAGLMLCAAGGCAGDAGQRQQLDQGEQALRAGDKMPAPGNSLAAGQLQAAKYDQAIQDANQVLGSGDTAFAAEAYYLRGRAEEGRPKFDESAAARDLEIARKDYNAALTFAPPLTLEARLHTQLGNVAYHRDDFAAALLEWSKAYEQLDRPEWKRWVLYYIGSCQQRLGRFSDADRTFGRLEQQYPGTEAAKLARQLAGTHAFYVQVGVYSQQADIERAAAAIVAAGAMPMKTVKNGLTTVRTGDIPSYAQAVAVRNRLWGTYGDARVLP